MRGLTGNILRTFSTQVPSIIISIISGIFLTRLLGAEGKGILGVFNTNIDIMVMIFAMGCEMGIIYFGSNKKISQEKLQGIAFLILSIFIPLIALVVIFLNVDFLFQDGYNNSFYKTFLIAMFAMRLFNSICSAFIRSHKNFKTVNRITLANSLFNVASFSLLYYLNSVGIVKVHLELIFSISLIIMGLNTLLLLVGLFRSVTIKLDLKLSMKEDILPFYIYIFPVFISLLINFLNYQFDIWVVNHYQGSIQLGLYITAVNFAKFILLYSQVIGGVMMPYLSEDNNEQRIRYFTTYARINFASVILMVGTLAFVGDFVLVFLYTKEFADSVAPFRVLLIGMVFSAMSQLFSIMLFSKGKNNVALLANTIGLIATVVLDFILIPKYGIMGAAWTTTIAYFCLFMVLLVYLLSKERIKLLDLFLIKKSDFTTIFQRD